MAQDNKSQTLRDFRNSIEKPIDRNSEVQPEDSASNIGSENRSRLSLRSRASSRSSTRSSTSAKARAAAKRAILEAEVAAVERLCSIEEEELRLQKRRRQLELQINLAKAEAEERAYAEAQLEDLEAFETVDEMLSDCSRVDHVMSKLDPLYAEATEQSSPTKEAGDMIRSINNQTKESRQVNQESHLTMPSNLYPQVSVPNGYNPKIIQPNENNGGFFERFESQDRQSYMFNQLLKQQQENISALTLPKPNLLPFDGDPTKYCDFIRAFENVIESKTSIYSARLYYLVQYTTGQVRELMRSCLPMKENEGYREARKLLLERYGQPYNIASALVDKIANGPVIRVDDGAGLQKLSVQLTSCSNTLKEIGYMSKLQNPDTLRRIIDRLPVSLKLKWRELVDTIMQQKHREVTVKDLTDFVVARARVANHPIFGKVNNSDGKNMGNVNNHRQPSKVRNYAIEGNQTDDKDGTRKCVKCPSCDSNHWLSQCYALKKLTVEDRHKFVRRKNLCNNCLVTAHFVKDCPKESFCRVQDCKEKHSTFLHPKRLRETPEPSKDLPKDSSNFSTESRKEEFNVEATSKESNNGYVRIKGENQFAVKVTSTAGLAVVPVKVKAKGTGKMIETYAFLDSGSNTSFCTEKLLNQLDLDGKRTTLSLTTLENVNTAVECSFVNLEVFDLQEENLIELSNVFSRPRLPISKDSIANQNDVDRWPYLTGVEIPQIDAEVGLLIGSDVPEALQPLEVRRSINGGPFATRTVLGWVLNGPLGR